MPLRLNASQWRLLLQWFVRDMTSADIARETRLDRKRILRALLVVRGEMRNLAVDELESSHRRPSGDPRTFEAVQDPLPASERLPVLALYASHGEFWGEVVSEKEAARIARALRDRAPNRSGLSEIGPYSAVVYRRRLYRPTESGEGNSAPPFGQIEAFWSYLQRQLRSRGGIRRTRLNLYLAEYAWRYNHRKTSPKDQVRELMRLVRHARRGVTNGSFPPDESSSFRQVPY